MTDPTREEREPARKIVDAWRNSIPEYRLQVYENRWDDLADAIARAIAARGRPLTEVDVEAALRAVPFACPNGLPHDEHPCAELVPDYPAMARAVLALVREGRG